MIKLPGLSVQETSQLIPPKTFLLGYRGSIAHGMYVPNTDPNSIDDKDVMGVCFAPLDCYLGTSHFEQMEKFVGVWDCVTYEVRKFLRLLAKSNPNVLSLLWLDEKHYIHRSGPAQLLIDSRRIFVTKDIYYAFTGYAYSQLKRMTHFVFEGYMGDKRKKLVQKFGYDTKNGAHLIRLLRMGIEFLKDGELHVQRHDAAQLLEIKHGDWTLDQVKVEAEKLFKRSEQAFNECKFPVRPDPKEVNQLCMDVMGHYLTEKIS